MKLVGLVVLLLGAGCATARQDEPLTVPATAPVSDPRIAEMQTTMTELLERMDVLNERIARLEENGMSAAAGASESVTPATTAEAAVATQQPQRALIGAKLSDDYRQAIMLFGRGKQAEARRGFQQVFDSDPTGDLADNALFWIGESYFAASDYANAVRYYNRVVSEFSEQNKAPDAMFKIALAQERSGDLALAKTTLQQVIERYPYSSTASTAKAELQRIRY